MDPTTSLKPAAELPLIPGPRDGHRSLEDVHSSVAISRGQWWRRLLSFSGPAFMVSVGYMDPGNWATDLAAGARFGYRLIWVILISNLMAILLQTLSARLGIVTGRDLAQACRDHYPRPVVWVLWILCEIAIAACDLAEVLGSAIALHLLFGIPILAGVLITALDVMLLLLLQSFGIRKMEAIILTLVATIGACFALEMFLSKPDLAAIFGGFVPSMLTTKDGPTPDASSLFIAIGIIGATVMPHNLYLHSALVQSRAVERTKAGLKEATKYNLIDSVVALNAAFFVNAAILILAAAAFYHRGLFDVARLEDAHKLLAPLLGSSLAPIAFAVALLAAGQSSTITGTLAGQIVMEGFVRMRLRPWLRRLVTRSIAIIPAVIVILWKGDGAVDGLLVLSQVILSLQLSFAVVPLIQFTSDRKKMGDFATPLWAKILAWLAAFIIISLNLKLVFETVVAGIEAKNRLVMFTLLPAALLIAPLLAWMIAEPFYAAWRKRRREFREGESLPTPAIPAMEATLGQKYRRIGIALEATKQDEQILTGILPLVRASGAEVVLIHIVESATARFIGTDTADEEARGDVDYMQRVAAVVREAGVTCKIRLGAGEPEDEIARVAKEEQLDLLVTGSHGHRLLGDILHGSTASELRHRTPIPVLTIRTGLK
ncbi:MAG TPA: Nramp family divalent metal transporter [Tepidisphaeraceae bacterium]|nr:Nramp family divalent metal transporter [Tepidisphaeraceae bacterium]